MLPRPLSVLTTKWKDIHFEPNIPSPLCIKRRAYESLKDKELKDCALDDLREVINEINYQITLGVCLKYRDLKWFVPELLVYPVYAQSSPVNEFQKVIAEQMENRQCVSYYVGEHKRKRNIPIEDKQREEMIIDNFKEIAKDIGFPADYMNIIEGDVKSLISLSKDVQKNLDKIKHPPVEISVKELENACYEPLRELDILELDFCGRKINEKQFNKAKERLLKKQSNGIENYKSLAEKASKPYTLYFIIEPLQFVFDK